MGCAPSESKRKSDLIQKIKKGNLIKTFNFDNLNLSSLKILNNHLESKDISVFSATNNKLKQAPANFFANINKITKIDFSHNRFEQIDDVIYQKQYLLYLNVSHNYIDKISTEIKNLVSLKELDLSHNLVTQLPPTIDGMVSLEILNISHNKFQIFPNVILLLEKLETLNASSNQINNPLPEENWEISKLKNLDLSFNKISIIPANLLKNSMISNLNLKGNLIEKSQLTSSEGFQEFEKRRKERKDQGYFKNLDITFNMCGLD